MYTNYILFVQSCIDGHLGCFDVLVIANYAVMNIDVQISLPDLAFSSSEYIPTSAIARSYGNYMLIF